MQSYSARAGTSNALLACFSIVTMILALVCTFATVTFSAVLVDLRKGVNQLLLGEFLYYPSNLDIIMESYYRIYINSTWITVQTIYCCCGE